jgi:hypothetical protein
VDLVGLRVPRFLFLLSTPSDPRAHSLGEWVARHAASGVIRSGARLDAGTRLERDGGVTTVGEAAPRWGFVVVEAEDARAALAIAASCPDPGPTVDLYRLDLADAVGEALADAATLR